MLECWSNSSKVVVGNGGLNSKFRALCLFEGHIRVFMLIRFLLKKLCLHLVPLDPIAATGVSIIFLMMTPRKASLLKKKYMYRNLPQKRKNAFPEESDNSEDESKDLSAKVKRPKFVKTKDDAIPLPSPFPLPKYYRADVEVALAKEK